MSFSEIKSFSYFLNADELDCVNFCQFATGAAKQRQRRIKQTYLMLNCGRYSSLIRLYSVTRNIFRMTKYRPIVISGPSGSGKSTLVQKLFAEFPGCFEFSVSHTTRKPREREVEGKDYFYVERSEFDDMVKEGKFLEHAQFSANNYGTSLMAVENVQATGRICVLDVEVNGVRSIKQTTLHARYLFIQPPSMDVLKERLQSRGTETEDSLKRRLDSAQEAFDYAGEKGSYDHIIVNDELDVAYEKLKGILIEDIFTVQKDKLKKGK